ncbi:MAG: protein kinase [Parabacteroides sp.]|nr:protein kinase [Parabacteroides sp.]
MNLPKGHLLQNGKYRLSNVVGQGGFGITYQGVWYTEVKGSLGTMRTEVPVCVKEYFFKDYCYRDQATGAVLVHSETGKKLFDKFKEKLIKEAKILSEVHHPYIVNVLEVFEEHNTAYIAMEYIAGHSLKYKMEKEGILPEPVVLKYIQQIGTALQFVHAKSILHLDIKPSNILIDSQDNARLIDFGVSKRYDIDQQETSTTMLTLSKGFASIEQYDDQGTSVFSPCPDIYSLGATMYNLLTGKIPTESILRATRPLMPPSQLNPHLSARTAAVILKAMEIVPADRYQSVEEMMEALSLPLLDVSQLPKSPVATASAAAPVAPEEADEETLLVSQGKRAQSVEDADEETIVNQSLNPVSSGGAGSSASVTPQPKKSSKALWVTLLLACLALLGSAAAYLHANRFTELFTKVDDPNPDDANLPQADTLTTSPEALSGEAAGTSDDGSSQEGSSLEVSDQADSSNPALVSQKAAAQPEKATSQATRKESAEAKRESAETRPEPVQKRPEPVRLPTETVKREQPASEAEQLLSAEEIDAEYKHLIALGQEQMSATNYAEAHRLFTEAKQLKLTEEVVRLLIDCDEKAEAKRIADRRTQYEEKMDFGNFKIVRKKSTGRYGAIDQRAEERIPCKYLSVGRSDQGRAFEREDNLYDIYRSDGSLVSQGVIDY